MLLIVFLGWFAARRTAILLVVAALPPVLCACSLRYDESYDRSKRDECALAPGTTTTSETAAYGEPAAEREQPVLFGVRFNHDAKQKRRENVEYHGNRNPYTSPSVKEQREARAIHALEQDIMARGGNTYVRYDGSSSKPSAVSFPAAPGALGLHLAASNRLNLANGHPTALTLIVYHLTDRVALDQIARSEDGMLALLAGEMFDASVVGVRELFVQPGMRNRLEIPRAEGGRYVAIVAGYNKPDPRTSLFVTSYPIGEYQKASEMLFMRETNLYVPLPLNLQVDLGDTGMMVTDTGKAYHNLRDSTKMQRQQKERYQRVTWQLKRDN